jgi:hypothetical protein
MKTFKANVMVGTKRLRERILWIRQDDIIEALAVTRKVKARKLNYIKEVSNKEYLAGVAKS